MKEQILALRPHEPIFIHTPLGLIEITKTEGKPGDGYRRLRFRMPEFMTAFLGDKKDLKQTELVTVNKDGNLIPTFSLLAPLVNKNGELVGVTPPGTLRLDEGVEAESTAQPTESEPE